MGGENLITKFFSWLYGVTSIEKNTKISASVKNILDPYSDYDKGLTDGFFDFQNFYNFLQSHESWELQN